MAIQRRLVKTVEVTESLVHVIRLKDIFDASTVNEFEKVVSYLLTRNFYKVVVDLGHVEFISSAGWGAFTAELRRVRQNQGDVKLANMTPDVYDIFLLLELDSFIQSFDTVDEALAAFSKPVVAPEPGPARSSILQELKAASHAREMAEAGARTVSEKPASDFFDRWRERPVAEQESYDEKRAGEPFEYIADRSAPKGERKATAPVSNDEESFGGQSEYVVDKSAAEAEYGDSSHLSDGEHGAVEQTEYAGDEYKDEGEYESSSADFDDESGTAERVESAGDEYANEGEYESSSADFDDESGTAEQAEYAGDEYAGEGEYEDSSVESYDEGGATGQAEYAGDEYAGEGEYEDSSVESYDESGATGQAEYAGDEYAGEGEYEDSSVELYDEDGATEQAEYAGEEYTNESEYESSSVQSYSEYDAVDQVEFAGGNSADEIEYDTASGDPAGSDDIEAQSDYAATDETGERGSEHLKPPAANDPEMWELILASGKPPVDPYMFKKSARMLPEGEKPQEFFASGAIQPFSGQPSEENSLVGAESELSASDKSWDADNDFEEFAELGAAPDFSFAGHEPFVEDNRRKEATSDLLSAAVINSHDRKSKAATRHGPGKLPEPRTEVKNKSVKPAPSRKSEHAEKSHAAFPEETDFAPTQDKPARDDEFDEFETQDIRDPWILEEIDTLPEEYEMEGGAADGEEPSFSASELLSYDLELDESFLPLPDQAYEREEIEAAGESPTHFEALSQAGVDDSFDNLGDSLAHDAEGEAQVAPGFAWQAEAHGLLAPDDLQGDFPAPSLTDENLAAPGDDSFDPPAKSEKKRTARIKKSKPKTKRAKPGRSNDSAENFFAPSPPLSSHNGNDEASHNYPPDRALPKIPASGNLEEIVRAVVATHPDFGAAMICKFIEDRFEPPVFISRSTIYRFLREADLNTREKRQEYADQLFDPSVLAEAI